MAGGGQGRRADAGQLAVVSIAAEPGIFGCDLRMGGGRGNVEVVGDFTALAGALEAAQELAALCLAVGRVELAQNVLV